MDEKIKEKIRDCMEHINRERDGGVVKSSRDAICFASGYLKTDYPELAEFLWTIIKIDY